MPQLKRESSDQFVRQKRLHLEVADCSRADFWQSKTEDTVPASSYALKKEQLNSYPESVIVPLSTAGIDVERDLAIGDWPKNTGFPPKHRRKMLNFMNILGWASLVVCDTWVRSETQNLRFAWLSFPD